MLSVNTWQNSQRNQVWWSHYKLLTDPNTVQTCTVKGQGRYPSSNGLSEGNLPYYVRPECSIWYHFTVLLNRLKFRFGLGGTIIEWLKSYLAGCTQQVALHNTQSDPAVLKQRVPQVSVLGPLLFSLYISPLGDICRRCNAEFHLYTDYQQNYFSFEPGPPTKSGIENLQECIQDICIWIGTNLLKLNDENIEFLLFGARQQLAKVRDISMKIWSDVIWPADQVRDLGVYWNNLTTTKAHVNKLCG